MVSIFNVVRVPPLHASQTCILVTLRSITDSNNSNSSIQIIFNREKYRLATSRPYFSSDEVARARASKSTLLLERNMPCLKIFLYLTCFTEETENIQFGENGL